MCVGVTRLYLSYRSVSNNQLMLITVYHHLSAVWCFHLSRCNMSRPPIRQLHSLFPPYMVGSQLSHPSPTSISVILWESCSLCFIIMITVEIDPALSAPHLTECTQSFLSLPGFNDELLSFQSPNMYELRSALLCLIRCLPYNVTCFT